MGRSRSASKSILSSVLFAAAAATAGYVVYRFLSMNRHRGGSDASSAVIKEIHKTQNLYNRRGKTVKPDRASSPPKVKEEPRGRVMWIQGLRVRERKILDMMPLKKPVKMSDISKWFPSVTQRTLRRDMDRLQGKGYVKQTGTTRATTYVKL